MKRTRFSSRLQQLEKRSKAKVEHIKTICSAYIYIVSRRHGATLGDSEYVGFASVGFQANTPAAVKTV